MQVFKDDQFVPAVAWTGRDAFSLRAKIVSSGITDEASIRYHLKRAHDILTHIPGINLRRYNPRVPMSGVVSG
jgi:hypothetical protein